MDPLYLRMTGRPDPEVFDPHWVEVAAPRFVLDRTVWRGDGVSRSTDRCVLLRADEEAGVWEVKNRSADRLLIVVDRSRRYELRTGMSMELAPGLWRGTLTDAYDFLISTSRPGDEVRRPAKSPVIPLPRHDDATRPRSSAMRARDYLGRFPMKRFALAHLWREHLAHTPDLARDLDPATVGRAFGVPGKTITRWREDLAENVYGERGHQGRVRDLVVSHGILTRSDVLAADRHVADRQRTGS